MKKYSSIINFVHGSIWLILPEKMDAMLEFLQLKEDGVTLDVADIELVAAQRRQPTASVHRNVAVLPVMGVISQRMGLMSDISGGTSTQRLGYEFDALMADTAVDAIVLDIDSPGGDYAGTPELAAKIFAARGNKPIVAVANSLAASAAYWIASAADEVVVTPSGEVGSIGALAIHIDRSAQNEKLGIKKTYINYGKYKQEMNPDAPLDEEAVVEVQRRIDAIGEEFVKTLAVNRRVSQKAVREGWGEGRMFPATEALERGMVNRVDTLEATVDRIANTRRLQRSRRVERERLNLLK